MTRPSIQIRHATALVHAVPGAELRLLMASGEHLMVGRHAAAQLGPCEWRQRLGGTESPVSQDRSEIRVAGLGGSLVAVGGGVYRDRNDPGTRWLTTDLAPRAAVAAMHLVPMGPVARDALAVTVGPDESLGVAVVRLQSQAPCVRLRLDDIAVDVAATLMVVELSGALTRLVGWEGTR